ncbi:hypothetical protein NDU88_004615 [Pleurodeles waltl]|uniref:Uncharacterized protein n=1 Tax=Pleurodeles waltl TaxID=8319 RepID=A0AAV7L582_PLEWA|nr:hypothetical protein NDU88_004615 [Pleurodeles waltl]
MVRNPAPFLLTVYVAVIFVDNKEETSIVDNHLIDNQAIIDHDGSFFDKTIDNDESIDIQTKHASPSNVDDDSIIVYGEYRPDAYYLVNVNFISTETV